MINQQRIKRTFSALGMAGVASVLALGFMGSSARAASLVPQQEGEVNVGFAAPLDGGSYLGLSSIITSIESLTDASTGTKSRLFVDKAGTDNTYGFVQFESTDLGTSDGSGSFWFRPVAMAANGIDPLIEGGQLEVGLFKFTFAKVVQELSLSFFDTEFRNINSGKGTSYTVEFGDGSTDKVFVPAGPNNNVQTYSLSSVKAITLDLGEKRGTTGDGVNVQVAVPEPGIIGGLGTLVVVGLLKRRQSNQEAADLA